MSDTEIILERIIDNHSSSLDTINTMSRIMMENKKTILQQTKEIQYLRADITFLMDHLGLVE
jgi:hypothetical protein